MARRYAFQIKEENLDLLEYLNMGVRPVVEGDGRPSIFIFTADRSTPGEIELEDNLYDADGNSIDPELVWM
jgi:hypothetical protein